MENPVLQIKDALIRVLKKIDPDTDVFFEEIKSTDPAHGVDKPKTVVFCGLKPGSPVTVDGIYTDMSVMVDVTYHEKGESNNNLSQLKLLKLTQPFVRCFRLAIGKSPSGMRTSM